MRLTLRPAVGAEIGLGHLRRSLTIAEEWIARGGTAAAVLDPVPVAVALAQRAGVDVVDDFGEGPAVLDGYAFDAAYHAHVRARASALLVLDDRAHLDRYDADLLLNQNPGADAAMYAERTDARLLLGPEYALIRREIREVRPEPDGSVLVTGGGSDPQGVTLRALEALRGLDAPRIVVAVGPFFAFEDALQAAAERDPRVELVRDPSMPELMRRASVAVAAAGSVALELAHLGIPQALIVAVDNQGLVGRGLVDTGAAVPFDALGELLTDPELRRRVGEAGRRVVDGRGVERVVAALASLA